MDASEKQIWTEAIRGITVNFEKNETRVKDFLKDFRHRTIDGESFESLHKRLWSFCKPKLTYDTFMLWNTLISIYMFVPLRQLRGSNRFTFYEANDHQLPDVNQTEDPRQIQPDDHLVDTPIYFQIKLYAAIEDNLNPQDLQLNVLGMEGNAEYQLLLSEYYLNNENFDAGRKYAAMANKTCNYEDESLQAFVSAIIVEQRKMRGQSEEISRFDELKDIFGPENLNPEYFQEPVQRSAPKVGRNDPCPCGSGKKYKNCCGKNVQA